MSRAMRSILPYAVAALLVLAAEADARDVSSPSLPSRRTLARRVPHHPQNADALDNEADRDAIASERRRTPGQKKRRLQVTRPPLATRPPISVPGVTRPPVGPPGGATTLSPTTAIPTFSPTISPTRMVVATRPPLAPPTPAAPTLPPVSAGTVPPVAGATIEPSAGPSAPIGSIVDVLSGDENFSTLVAAVTAAGLADALAEESPLTVFAPTNEAFALLPPETVETLLLPENVEALQDILLYHVVPDEVTFFPALSGDTAQKCSASETWRRCSFATLNGESVVVIDTGMVNDANVAMADIPASNGVVHAIDRVLLPPEGTEAPSAGPTTAPAAVIATPFPTASVATEAPSAATSEAPSGMPSDAATVPATAPPTVGTPATMAPVAAIETAAPTAPTGEGPSPPTPSVPTTVMPTEPVSLLPPTTMRPTEAVSRLPVPTTGEPTVTMPPTRNGTYPEYPVFAKSSKTKASKATSAKASKSTDSRPSGKSGKGSKGSKGVQGKASKHGKTDNGNYLFSGYRTRDELNAATVGSGSAGWMVVAVGAAAMAWMNARQ